MSNLKNIIEIAASLFKNKENNIHAIKNTTLPVGSDEDLIFSNSILALNQSTNPTEKNILELLTVCADAKLKPPTNFIPFEKVKSLKKTELFESPDDIREAYLNLIDSALSYIKERKAAKNITKDAPKESKISDPIKQQAQVSKNDSQIPVNMTKKIFPGQNFLGDLKSALNNRKNSNIVLPAPPIKTKLPETKVEKKLSPTLKPPAKAIPAPIISSNHSNEYVKNLEEKLAALEKKLKDQLVNR